VLYALPLDSTMWRSVGRGLRHEVVAPSLYQFGSTLEEWAAGVLRLAGDGPLVVVGNSVGGSCAIEVARLAPAAVRHLVLIGAKPGHRLEPGYRDAAVRLLETGGMEAAWPLYWQPLLGPAAPPAVLRSGPADRPRTTSKGRHPRCPRLPRPKRPLAVPERVARASDGGQRRVRHRTSAKQPWLTASATGGTRWLPVLGHYVPLESPTALRELINDAVAEVA
jgi:pimeloyl-ACP methyl ester carboxylesterase